MADELRVPGEVEKSSAPLPALPAAPAMPNEGTPFDPSAATRTHEPVGPEEGIGSTPSGLEPFNPAYPEGKYGPGLRSDPEWQRIQEQRRGASMAPFPEWGQVTVTFPEEQKQEQVVDIETLFQHEAALDGIAGNQPALKAMPWDSIENRVNPDGSTDTVAHDATLNQSFVLDTKPPKTEEDKSTTIIVEENGKLYDVQVRPDGSQHLLGETGKQRTGVSVQIAPPTAPKEPEVTKKELGPLPLTPEAKVERLTPGESVKNPDGTKSTEYSITVEDPRLNDGKPTNIPTIWKVDGKIVRLVPHGEAPNDTTQEAAISHAIKSGERFPAYDTVDEAVAAAKTRSSAGGRFADLPKKEGQPVAAPEPTTDHVEETILQKMFKPYGAAAEEVARATSTAVHRAIWNTFQATGLNDVVGWLEQNIGGAGTYTPQFTPQTTPGEIAADVGEVVVELAPAAKVGQGVSAAVKAVKAFPKAVDAVARILGFATTGAAIDYVQDPETQTMLGELLNDIGQLPDRDAEALRSAIAEALAKQESDSAFEKRIKQVTEGALMGSTVAGLVKIYKAARSLAALYPSQAKALGVVVGIGITMQPDEAQPATAKKIVEDILKLTQRMPSDAGGLIYPPEAAADRLRKRLAQKEKERATGEKVGQLHNERTVIAAPRGSGLPNFVVGKITPADWVRRTERILSKEEIEEAAGWYGRVRDAFVRHTGGNEELADRYMRAWLVANQKTTVSTAMSNTLLQAEQLNRGVSREEMRLGGLRVPSEAARTVLEDEELKAGAAAKIADFVDSALGKSVRSWMGNLPEGGKPFVVDIHSFRDLGGVDPTLKSHLKGMGYDAKQIDDLATDTVGTGVKDNMYEEIADRGRKLTDYLNKKNWQGRSDWQPSEVQAIGWHTMTKLTRGKLEDTVTALEANLRRISFEFAPGSGSPMEAKYGQRYANLSLDKQRQVTERVATKVFEIVKKETGIDVAPLVHGFGGWQNLENASAVAQALSSKHGAAHAADMIGYLLQQSEVWVNTVKVVTKAPKGFAVDLIEHGPNELGNYRGLATDADQRELFAVVRAADKTGLLEGYQPILTADGRRGIRILIDKGGAKRAEALSEVVDNDIIDAVNKAGFGIDATRHEAEIVKRRNDWREHPNGEEYLERLEQAGGRDSAARLVQHSVTVDEEAAAALRDAEREQRSDATGIGSQGFRNALAAVASFGAGLALGLDPASEANAGPIDEVLKRGMGIAKPFYSKALRTAETSTTAKATGDQWLGILKNQGVKQDEIAWTGLDDYLKGRASVTRDQIVEYLQANQIKIREITKGSGASLEQFGWSAADEAKYTEWNLRLDKIKKELPAGRKMERLPPSQNAEIVDLFNRRNEAQMQAHDEYRKWSLPGAGELNHRELLFQLDTSPRPPVAGQTAKETRTQTKRLSKATYSSGHYEDTPNVLFHARVTDRMAGDRKVLMVEEIQSDWHQAGRDKGYSGSAPSTVLWRARQARGPEDLDFGRIWNVYDGNGEHIRTVRAQSTITADEAIREAAQAIERDPVERAALIDTVPHAPLEKTWQEAAFRRMVRYAAENGYDSVAWTTGKQQADRYKKPEILKGMEGFYDKMLVDYAGKFGKKFGATVEDINLGASASPGTQFRAVYDDGTVGPLYSTWNRAEDAMGGSPGRVERVHPEDQQIMVHALDITPQMRETALKEGFPLFGMGVGPAVAGTALATQSEGPAPESVSPAGEQTAGLFDRLMKPFIGRAGREARRAGTSPTAPELLRIPPAAEQEIARTYSPYRTDSPVVEGVDFNMRNLRTSDQVKEFIDTTSRVYEQQQLEITGGVVSHKITRQLADLTNASPESMEKMIRELPGDTKDLHVRALVMRDALVASAEEIDRAAWKIANTPTLVSDEELLAFREQVERHRQLQLHMKGVQTDIARALSAFRIPAEAGMGHNGGPMMRGQLVLEGLQAGGGRDTIREFAKLWMQTPVEARGGLVAEGWKAKSVSALREMWINGLLSSPRTHEVNLASNFAFTAMMIPERFAAGVVGKARHLITGSEDYVRMGEAGALLHGWIESIPDALKLGWATFKEGAPQGASKIEGAQRRAISSENFGLDEGGLLGRAVDLIGTGVRLPGRFLMSADEFNKAIGRQMERRAQALRLSEMDLARGKTPAEAAQTYTDVMHGLNEAAEKDIENFASTVTFTKQLGEGGQALQQLVSRAPGAWIIMPFVRTPTNVIKETLDRTPFGVPSLYRDLKAGGAKADLAIAKIGLGSSVMGWVALDLAGNDIVTGGGPSDPERQKMWRIDHEPYSINLRRFLGDATFERLGLTKEWVPYGRLAPIGTIIGISADIAEYRKWAPRELAEAEDAAIMTKALGATVHYLGDQTFLQGLSTAAAAWKDPDRYAEQFLTQLGVSMTPGIGSRLASDIEKATDPTNRSTRPDPYEQNPAAREFQAYMRGLQAQTPGWSTDLPPRVNFWGQEIKAFEGDWWEAFNAFNPKGEKGTPIDKEFARLHYPLTEFSREAFGVKLTEKQYVDMVRATNEVTLNKSAQATGSDATEAGPANTRNMTMREYLGWTVQSAIYQNLTDEQKIGELRRIVHDFKKMGQALLVRPDSPYYDVELAVLAKSAASAKQSGMPFRPR